MPYILQDIEALGTGVNWSNASIAIHGYGFSELVLEDVIQNLKVEGYSIINTEPANIGDEMFNFRQTRLYETENISYLHFLTTEEIRMDNKYKNIIEDYGISWIPDFGTWPSNVAPHIKTWPANQRIEAEFFDELGGNGVLTNLNYIGYLDNGDYIKFLGVDFEDGQNVIASRIATPYSGRKIEVVIDSIDGDIIGSCPVTNTGDWGTWQTVECEVDMTEGEHALYLKFNGSFDLDWIQFSNNTINDLYDNYGVNDNNILIFPNPGTDEIEIDFNVAIAGVVKLNILNSNGNMLSLLIDAYLEPGYYTRQFTFTDTPSGIYWVQLKTPQGISYQKILVINR